MADESIAFPADRADDEPLDAEDDLDAGRGILTSVLLSIPLWAALYYALHLVGAV